MNTIDARRIAGIGRITAAVLAVSAAVTWAVGIPGLRAGLPERSAPLQPAVAPEAPKAVAVSHLDREGALTVADNFERVGGVKKVEERTVAAAETPPPPPEPSAWTYLGPITEPGRRCALISFEGHQKVLAEGRSYGDTKLVSVSPDEIVTENASGQHRITRGDRSEVRVAWVKTMPSNAPLAAAAPGDKLSGRTIQAMQPGATQLATGFQAREQARRARGQPGGLGGQGPGGGGGRGDFRGDSRGAPVSFNAVPAADGQIAVAADLEARVAAERAERAALLAKQRADQAGRQ